MTLAQDNARRMNALKSTGPKTEAGKARVAVNAVKHGIYARHPDLVDLPCRGDGESAERLAELKAHYQPKTPVEEILVERIAALEWRLKRSIFAERKAIHMQPGNEYSLPPAGALERILRYERTMDRELYRAIGYLEQLIGARLKNAQNKAEDSSVEDPDLRSENKAEQS